MKRKNKARIGGVSAFVGVYVGLSILTPLFPKGTWAGLVALMIGAWVADKIDPVNP